MLQVARLAPKLLGDSSALVQDFYRRQQNPDGGFRDRGGASDLYYTVFGIEGLLALQAAPPPSLLSYLDTFGAGETLDFVHVCCLARCRSALAAAGVTPAPSGAWSHAVLQRVEHFRSGDGGYRGQAGSPSGTAYNNFMALAAYQDLGTRPPTPERLLQSVAALATPDGAWGNERNLRVGATNATAAAVTFLRQARQPLPPAVGDWLLARHNAQGGFLAMPSAPLPDLLSTATALHALAGLERSVAAIKEACLDFVDSLWTNEGGFHGHWGDDLLDCEYTYYGLLALGHLAL
jgi:hypothetical protein